MSERIQIEEAKKRSGLCQQHIEYLCSTKKWDAEEKDGQLWINVNSDPLLALEEVIDNTIDSKTLKGIPVRKLDEAFRRLGTIKEFEKFVWYSAQEGRNLPSALSLFVAMHEGITKRSFQRWCAKYKDQGLLGLVDQRGIGVFISQTISPGAFELFKSMYLTQQRLSIKTCWQNIDFINRDEVRGWKVPPLQFMYRFVKNRIPVPVQILHREGLAAYEARCAPYIQVDPDSVEPGQVWVGDHGQFNCWIRHRGKWIRPWLTAWQDMRSRAIVGWHISSSPNQTTILLAAKRGIEEHGPPDSAKIDNGRDYDSECWTGTTKVRRRAFLKAGYIDEQMVAGIYAMLDIGVSFSIKYHPQSKPIERFFDTLDCQFTKTVPTYCGKDTERKPDYLNDLLKNQKAIKKAYDLVGFAQAVGRYIEAYSAAAHSGVGMNGRSPAEVLATRQSRRCLSEGVLDLLMRVWSGELTVGKNGVRFKKIWYGQYNTDLILHQGRKVRVAYDPDDLRQLYIYDATTLRLITIAEQNQLVRYGAAVSEESLREAMHQKSRAVKIARQFRDSRLTANMDLTDLAVKAMQEASEKSEQPAAPTLRPVRTPLDDQVAEHKRRETVKAVKKAAGAESIETVLDIDLSLLKRERKYVDLDFMDE